MTGAPQHIQQGLEPEVGARQGNTWANFFQLFLQLIPEEVLE